MTLEQAASQIPCLVVLLIPGWSVWRLVRGVRVGQWRRPGWFGHAAWASFVLALLAWLRGVFAGGLDVEQTCTLRHGQRFDPDYYAAHRQDWFQLFPVTNKCHAGYELVPGWVNPAVAVFFLLFLVSSACLVGTATQRLRQRFDDRRRS